MTLVPVLPRNSSRQPREQQHCWLNDSRCRDLEKRVVELEERLKKSEAANASLTRVLESTQAQLERANTENTMPVTSEYTASLVPNPLALAAELKKLYGDDHLVGDTEFWAHLIESANSGIALPSDSFAVKSRFLDDSELEKPIPARQHNSSAPDPMVLAKTLKRSYRDDDFPGEIKCWAHIFDSANSQVALPSDSFFVFSQILRPSEFSSLIPEHRQCNSQYALETRLRECLRLVRAQAPAALQLTQPDASVVVSQDKTPRIVEAGDEIASVIKPELGTLSSENEASASTSTTETTSTTRAGKRKRLVARDGRASVRPRLWDSVMAPDTPTEVTNADNEGAAHGFDSSDATSGTQDEGSSSLLRSTTTRPLPRSSHLTRTNLSRMGSVTERATRFRFRPGGQELPLS